MLKVNVGILTGAYVSRLDDRCEAEEGSSIILRGNIFEVKLGVDT